MSSVQRSNAFKRRTANNVARSFRNKPANGNGHSLTVVAEPATLPASLKIDVSKLTIGEVMSLQRNELSDEQVIGLLNKVVIGGVDQYPITELSEIGRQLVNALSAHLAKVKNA